MGRLQGHKHFGGAKVKSREDRAAIALQIMPYLRGAVSRKQRWIGSFIGSAAGAGVCELGAGGEAGASGDELPGPLYPDEDSSDVYQVGSGG